MKKTVFILCTLLLCALSHITMEATEVQPWSNVLSVGENYLSADGNVRTYSRPIDYTLIDGKPQFNVFIDGHAYTGIYQTTAESGQMVCFGSFDFKDGRSVKITVICSQPLGEFEMLPSSADVSDIKRVDEKTVSFTITKANQWLTFVAKGNFRYGRVLHLFCNDMHQEPQAAKKDGSYDRKNKIYYFGPGYYDLTIKYPDGLFASNGRTIYIAGGAVIKGSVGIGSGGGKIYGHGMVVIDNDQDGSELACSYADGGEVNGIMCHRYHARGWQTTYTYCKNLNIKNMKVICPDGGSSDGMDFQGCQNITVDNCFIASNDDCVAIKGLAADGSDPANCTQQAEKNLTFSNMQFWTCANNAFGIGAETYASSFENISLKDSEVLFHWDLQTHTEGMGDRAALNICALTGTYIHDIRFENIIVHHCDRFIGMGFEDSFWYGSIKGYQKYPGEICNVYFTNVSCPNTQGLRCSNDVHLYGWDGNYNRNKGWYVGDTPTKKIHDIYFDNVSIEGKPFDSWNHPNLITNNTVDVELVYDLHFNEHVAGIGCIETDRNKTKNEIYFTIDGLAVGNNIKALHPGLYVCQTTGGKKRKIIVR